MRRVYLTSLLSENSTFVGDFSLANRYCTERNWNARGALQYTGLRRASRLPGLQPAARTGGPGWANPLPTCGTTMFILWYLTLRRRRCVPTRRELQKDSPGDLLERDR